MLRISYIRNLSSEDQEKYAEMLRKEHPVEILDQLSRVFEW